ncbi:hypothetical protein [Streptomyces malaysiensis]|uniref:hypothetical protein n=1 Tax=Streptomyces malaysiensis TaxID=92644 RepID=UPI002B2BB9D8|nr:hypothetical protein R8789_11880 [Streptomyces malaysiensis]
MRMLFEPEDEEFDAAAEMLASRVEEWAREHGEGADADAFVVQSALDYRHRGTVDGRLGLWRAAHVEGVLLDWLPRTLTVLPGQPLPDGPGSLLALLRYFDAFGLADPRGDGLTALESAVSSASGEFGARMADRTRWGPAKFWAVTAAEQGVDIMNQAAMARFAERARRGEVPYDREALDAIMTRHMTAGPAQGERAEPQLPVTLPEEDVLRERAAAVPLIGQLAGLAGWAGSEGRDLTKTDRPRLADARDLVRVLDTGDPVEQVRTSAELPRVNLLFAWAKQARLIRVAKGRVYAVAKARPVLADPLALWERAFEAFFELRGPLLGGPDGYDATSMLFDVYQDVLPDILNTLYSLPYPMPWPRLRDSVHLAYRMSFTLGEAPEREQRAWLLDADHDLRHVLDVLERLGAITREQGMADPVFLDTALDEPPAGPQLPTGMPAELAQLLGSLPAVPDPSATARAKELRAELASSPVELIRLTDLGTRAVRRRLIAQGRSAPLVGELTHAPAAGLLGVLAQEYDPEHAEAELAAWTAAHDSPGHARRLLLEAVRTTPFRTRAAALLDTLATALPDGTELLRSLRGDPDLAPTALTVLSQRGALDHEDLTDTEAALMVAESLLQLLDLGGEQALLEALLVQGRAEAETAIGAALASAHPDRAGLEALRHLADGPLRAKAAQLVRQNATGTRARRSTTKKRKRRR